MGILDPVTPVSPTPDYPAMAAARIRAQTRQTFQIMAQAFNAGAKLFWRHPKATAEEIAAELGTDAREIFELHGKLGALLAQIKPESIASGMALVGQFEYNDDGNVTIINSAASSTSQNSSSGL